MKDSRFTIRNIDPEIMAEAREIVRANRHETMGSFITDCWSPILTRFQKRMTRTCVSQRDAATSLGARLESYLDISLSNEGAVGS